MNTFNIGVSYNAVQTMTISALANNCSPLFKTDMTYFGTEQENDDVTLHVFDHKSGKQYFDDAFINNGKSFDNSVIITERNLTVRNSH